MQNIFYSIILGAVQGLTEFLPVSSTSHLILFEKFLGLDPELFGLDFNLVLHLATLFAVIIYFRKYLKVLTKELFVIIKTRKIVSYDQKIVIYVLLTSIPALLIGYFLKDLITGKAYNVEVIGVFLIIFSILYWVIEKYYSKKVKIKQKINGFKVALFIALAQDIALIPGVSRSGITYSAGLLMGLDRKEVSRFSFLLSIPIIAGATFYKLLNSNLFFGEYYIEYSLGFIFSFFTGLLAINIFMNYISKKGLGIFLTYRILLGTLVLIITAIGGLKK